MTLCPDVVTGDFYRAGCACNRHADDECRADHAYVRAPVELLFAVRAVKPMHGQVRVRQQRERQVVALAETLQLVDWVLGDAQHSETECGEPGNVVAEVACLGGAARRHRGRIEVQHHALALRQQPRQRDGGLTAVRVDRRQGEIRSGLAGGESRGKGGLAGLAGLR